MTPSLRKKWIIVGGSIAVFLVFLAAFNFWMFEQRTKRPSPGEILYFYGNIENASVSATMTRLGRTEALRTEGLRVRLTEEQAKEYRLPFVLSATIKTSKGERKVDFDIDSNGINYYINMSGFVPGNSATLFMDGDNARTEKFSDAGTLTFPIILIIAENHEVCVTVDQADGPFSFCHRITGNAR